MPLQRVALGDLRDTATLLGLLRLREPFVVRGAPFPRGAFQTALDVMRRSKVRVWDQGNDFYQSFKEAFARTEDGTCPCIVKSVTDVVASGTIDTTRDFQVIVPHVLFWNELDGLFVRPLMRDNLRAIEGVRHTKLFTTFFISRGRARGGVHGHNFDTFSQFFSMGGQTRAYFFPPEAYSRLGACAMFSGGAGTVTLHPTREDEMMSEALVHDAEPGDILHTPLGWFHRFDHDGEYTNLATAVSFDDLVEDRLAAVRPVMPAADFEMVAEQTRMLRYFPVLGPLDHLMRIVGHEVPPIGRAVDRIKRLRSSAKRREPLIAVARREPADAACKSQ